ncbi:MAG TPA: pyrroline-5-carboxylate reductase [Rhodocyclaceae bacterium]|nr:pyrroline-5-carboxylate reductase [Rhodocyclaceae bacterium]
MSAIDNGAVRISFLGGGNMAGALIGGMLERGFDARKLRVVDLAAENCARLAERFGVSAATSVADGFLACDLLVLAVKPQQLRAAVAPLAGHLREQVVVSIAAGIRTADLARWVVRAMPNTPALIGAGVTGLYAAAEVDANGRASVARVLSSVGSTVWVDQEALIDSVTAVSGSGPAYVFHFIEALEAAGKAQGFDAGTARKLAIDTVLGAARLAHDSEDGPGVLRERVTSKGGTTAAALASLADADFMGVIDRAVAAARARGRELGDELGRD